MFGRAGEKRSLHQVGYRGRRCGRVERKKFERVKSLSLQPSLNFLVRKPTWTVGCCGAVPQLLDSGHFKFINRTRKKTSDVKKLVIPDCIEDSGLMHEENDDADLLHCGH